VGQGTAFFIYLPRLLATKQLPGEQTAPVILNGGTETILVVEDEKSLRTLAVRVLKHSGYRVLEASDGPEALKVWHEHYREVDLLVTDVIMPGGMSGGKLADQLRSEKPGLKVIYMSGYSGDVAGIGLNLRDGRQFLQKPFPPSKLVQTVREYLDAV
jgi:CheY-like chemotaxis protein